MNTNTYTTYMVIFILTLAASPINSFLSRRAVTTLFLLDLVSDAASNGVGVRPTRVHHQYIRSSNHTKRADQARRGDATYYSPGKGACGQTSSDRDLIVAVSHEVYDNYAGADGNSNDDPICGKKIRATYGSNTVIITVVDRCTACTHDDLDLSPSAFSQLGPKDAGRLHGMKWHFL